MCIFYNKKTGIINNNWSYIILKYIIQFKKIESKYL